MVRVRKSPNMMSTTGRRPVMAAPTPIPVKPASEMGVSITRSEPNSSTKPERTLKGVPASATSSPKMQTLGSRRISSASASRTACANVSSRSGIDVLLHLVDAGIRCSDGEFDGGFHLRARFGSDLIERGSVGISLSQQPVRVQLDGIAFGLPRLLFLLGTIIFAADVADVMAAVAVCVGLEKSGAVAGASPRHQSCRDFVHRAHILPINHGVFETESGGAAENGSGCRLREMRVFVVEIVFADVDDGQLPELREVHHFVKRALAERAFAEKTDGDASVAEAPGGERRAGSDADAASYDCIRAEVAGGGIGNVHGAAFTAAIARFLAQKLGEHAVGGSALGQTVSVAAVGAGDVVVEAEGFADANGNGFFAAVEMGQAGHEGAGVEFVDLIFEQADANHLAIGAEPAIFVGGSCCVGHRWHVNGFVFCHPPLAPRS